MGKNKNEDGYLLLITYVNVFWLKFVILHELFILLNEQVCMYLICMQMFCLVQDNSFVKFKVFEHSCKDKNSQGYLIKQLHIFLSVHKQACTQVKLRWMKFRKNILHHTHFKKKNFNSKRIMRITNLAIVHNHDFFDS